MNNDPSQHQSATSANLPVVPAQPQAGAPVAGQAPGVDAGSDTTQVVLQAKQLVVQYQQSPFQLSEALQRLKGAYLAEHYNVSPNTVEK